MKVKAAVASRSEIPILLRFTPSGGEMRHEYYTGTRIARGNDWLTMSGTPLREDARLLDQEPLYFGVKCHSGRYESASGLKSQDSYVKGKYARDIPRMKCA